MMGLGEVMGLVGMVGKEGKVVRGKWVGGEGEEVEMVWGVLGGKRRGRGG